MKVHQITGSHLRTGWMDAYRGIEVLFRGSLPHSNSISLGHLSCIGAHHMEANDSLLHGQQQQKKRKKNKMKVAVKQFHIDFLKWN